MNKKDHSVIAKLMVTTGSMSGISIALPKQLIIGQGKKCDLQLQDSGIAEFHCKIYAKDDRFYIENLDDQFKTVVNKIKITSQSLQENDHIEIGNVVLKFSIPEEETSPMKTHFENKEDPFEMPDFYEDDPRKIGDYIILQHLGTGATGDVFKAENFITHKIVALKILHAKDIDEHTLKRFVQEVQICSEFNHPRIVKVFEFGMFKGRPLIAMEYINGISLEEYIKENESLTPIETLKTAGQIAQALNYTHKKGVVHRDLKPSNILLQNKKNIKIIDFGVIKVQGNCITFANQMIGTIRYIPPEQIDDAASVDERADIYSLGALMYFLVTGKPPYFETEGLESLILNIHTERATSINNIASGIPKELCNLVEKAMEKEIDKRFKDIPEMFQEIINVLKICQS